MRLIVSIGDANGIGLEVFYKAIELVNNCDFSDELEIALAGDYSAVKSYFSKMNYDAEYLENKMIVFGREISIEQTIETSKINLGDLMPDSGKLAGAAIELSLNSIKAGQYDALLTLPISKEAIKMAGFNFPGHTEMIGNFCNFNSPLMILCSDTVRVALVTIHESIRKVPDLITEDLIIDRIKQFSESLIIDYGIKKPKIAVLGLNPHSGENGKIGKEENEIIIPAINKSEFAYGPFPADGFFAHGDYKNYDGILAMYHDQGLIPLKMLAAGAGVNFTAGLPIIRTSPDHGTAFSIAGKNIAEAESTFNAIKLALSVYKNRIKIK